MKKWGWWPAMVVLAAALLSFASTIQAATTVQYVNVGDTFTGTIGTSGVDTVEGRFNVAEGTAVRIAVKTMQGSSLEPTVALKNGAGSTISGGTTLSIDWLPVPHVIHLFTVPSSGTYVAEIGGASGSGDFSATINGRIPGDVQMTDVSGQVTDFFTGEGVADAAVNFGAFMLVTDATGVYSASLPAGSYTATFAAPDFVTATESVDLVAGTPSVVDVTLFYVEAVLLSTEVSGDMVPGGTITATVTPEVRDGSTIESITWTQKHGVEAEVTGADTNTVTVTLGSESAFKDELIHFLSEPPVTAEQLPPNVPLPPGEFPGGLQDRFQVVGINPFALEETGLVAFEVEVVTSNGGVFHEEVEIHATIPWKSAAGIRSVAVGTPVLLHGKDQESYDWLLLRPDGSEALLTDPLSRNPWFVPDVPGTYMVQVTDGTVETDVPVMLQVFAGNWRGVIVGQDAEGRPEADGACLGCHGGFAPDKFTPWKGTGHAEIFTNNLNTSTHYGPNCFPCHTVGYDPGVENGGADDASDYEDFLAAGLLNSPGDNWTEVLDQFPEFAMKANIQCENCHGPQNEAPGADTRAHGWRGPIGEPRVSLSSDVCAVCHGEPLRHARFQQWQLSAHANYELAIDEGDSGNCSRCHTGNGFLEWVDVLLDDDPETDPLDNITVTWERDETHPQTCVVCHDPHDIGTTSGNNTNVNIRVSDDTPPLIAGFTATDVGRGAMCMTCHNSRRGLRNDETFPTPEIQDDLARAPHGSAQTDVLMGQNAFLVETGNRGNHSLIEDTCVNCHMQATPPPDVLAYNQGGANHTFYAGSEICADCHGSAFTAAGVQSGVNSFLDRLQGMIEDALFALMTDLTDSGLTIDLDGDRSITDTGEITEIVFGEYRGRQSMEITFTDREVLGPYRMTDIDVRDIFSAKLGELYDFAEPGLIKSGWNWNLVHNDGSAGIHNPNFVWNTLIATSDALMGLGGGMGAAASAADSLAAPRTPFGQRPWVERRRPRLIRLEPGE